MRFTSLVSIAAIVAVAGAPGSLAKWRDISADVEKGLTQIENGIIGLRDAFGAFLQGGQTHPEAGQLDMEAGANLSQALNYTTMALENCTASYIKKSESDEVAQLYKYIAGNITIVTTALKQNKEGIVKAGVLQVVHQVLPPYETQFERLGLALLKKTHKKEFRSVQQSWTQIDNELESTLAAFNITDASCDSNPIARRGARGLARRGLIIRSDLMV